MLETKGMASSLKKQNNNNKIVYVLFHIKALPLHTLKNTYFFVKIKNNFFTFYRLVPFFFLKKITIYKAPTFGFRQIYCKTIVVPTWHNL